jgi:hypothetical protein
MRLSEFVERSNGLVGHARGLVAAVGKADVAALPSGSTATVISRDVDRLGHPFACW